MAQTAKKRISKRLVLLLTAMTFGMFGFGYALVPLYDLFCEITGVGGSPTIGSPYQIGQLPDMESDRDVWVEFTGNSTNGLPWTVEPQVKKAKLKIGEVHEFTYLVKNTSGKALVAQAVPSISPMQSARHLVKLECFCFENQPLAAGESRQMPVVFYIDPKLSKDTATLTLSYSFFEVKDSEQATS